jgi:hypothetical protein
MLLGRPAWVGEEIQTATAAATHALLGNISGFRIRVVAVKDESQILNLGLNSKGTVQTWLQIPLASCSLRKHAIPLKVKNLTLLTTYFKEY